MSALGEGDSLFAFPLHNNSFEEAILITFLNLSHQEAYSADYDSWDAPGHHYWAKTCSLRQH